MDDEKDECKEGRKLAVDFDLLNVLNTEVGRLNSKRLQLLQFMCKLCVFKTACRLSFNSKLICGGIAASNEKHPIGERILHNLLFYCIDFILKDVMSILRKVTKQKETFHL